jgi:hypothetical protein
MPPSLSTILHSTSGYGTPIVPIFCLPFPKSGLQCVTGAASVSPVALHQIRAGQLDELAMRLDQERSGAADARADRLEVVLLRER